MWQIFFLQSFYSGLIGFFFLSHFLNTCRFLAYPTSCKMEVTSYSKKPVNTSNVIKTWICNLGSQGLEKKFKPPCFKYFVTAASFLHTIFYRELSCFFINALLWCYRKNSLTLADCLCGFQSIIRDLG